MPGGEARKSGRETLCKSRGSSFAGAIRRGFKMCPRVKKLLHNDEGAFQIQEAVA